MNFFKSLCLIALVLSLWGILASCTGLTDPSGAIVDLRGVDRGQYYADLADCRRYADEVALGKQVAAGAAAGAVTGAAVGAVSGDDKQETARKAGVGAVAGGTIGGVKAAQEKRRVLRECLAGRGYRVLN